MQINNIKKALIFIVPVLIILWQLWAMHMAGPFYLSRIDPEYPYLLNGLNCAIFEYGRIGHTDHPGTPFQILTGVFIWIIYIITGKSNMVEDVISRPEVYLHWSAFFISLITAVVLVWIGKILLRNKFDILSVLIIQFSIFFNATLVDLSIRYIPDRMFIIYIFLFIGISIKFLYQENYKEKRFAIFSGILMGIAFATKFNFLPILVIPFLMIKSIKNHFIYLFSLLVAFFLSILPIYDKFSQFRDFIVGIFKHDGMYGQGSEQVINYTKFIANLETIYRFNTSFIIIVGIILFLLVCYAFSSSFRKKNKSEFVFMIVFILSVIVNTIMVAKQYKNYYLTPVLSLGGFMFFITYVVATKVSVIKRFKWVFAIFLLMLLYFPVFNTHRSFTWKVQKKSSNDQIVAFVEDHITEKDLLLIEPTWMSGPSVTNGLVFGVSYVGRRHLFYPVYSKVFPNVITYEGQGKPFKYFRMKELALSEVLTNEKSIFILDTPGRNARKVIEEFKIQATQYGFSISSDTVFSDTNRKEYFVEINPYPALNSDTVFLNYLILYNRLWHFNK